MGANDVANEIERIIGLTIDQYESELGEFSGTLYNRLVRALKDLELDSEGHIKQSSANRKVLSDAELVIDELLPGRTFTEIISNTLRAINSINEVNASYFSSVSESFKENRNFIKSLQAQTIKNIESNLLEDGLTVQVKNPLVGILNRNVNSGGQFSGFLEEIRDFVKGNEEVDSRILSYSRTYLSDTLFDYSRAYQEAMTNDLRLDWYLWAGGIQDTSRSVCVEHAGKYFRREEIESIADQNWSGKRPGTTKSSIFIFVGGFNCKHSLIPVHESIVPKEDLERFAN
jgi:hypothetical protein